MLMVLSFDTLSLSMVLAGQHETLDFYCYFYTSEGAPSAPAARRPRGLEYCLYSLRDLKLTTHFCNLH